MKELFEGAIIALRQLNLVPFLTIYKDISKNPKIESVDQLVQILSDAFKEAPFSFDDLLIMHKLTILLPHISASNFLNEENPLLEASCPLTNLFIAAQDAYSKKVLSDLITPPFEFDRHKIDPNANVTDVLGENINFYLLDLSGELCDDGQINEFILENKITFIFNLYSLNATTYFDCFRLPSAKLSDIKLVYDYAQKNMSNIEFIDFNTRFCLFMIENYTQLKKQQYRLLRADTQIKKNAIKDDIARLFFPSLRYYILTITCSWSSFDMGLIYSNLFEPRLCPQAMAEVYMHASLLNNPEPRIEHKNIRNFGLKECNRFGFFRFGLLFKSETEKEFYTAFSQDASSKNSL